MKVVICDYEFDNNEPEKEALKHVPELEFVPRHCRSEKEVMDLTQDADGVLNQWSHLTEKVINNMQKCKVIATYGIGVDKIDVAAATKKGIFVYNVPDYCINEVSNHTIAMLMALSRQLFPLDRLIREGKYGFMHLDRKLYKLEGQTVGLLGFGKIPRIVAKKLQNAFNMKIVTYDPFVSEKDTQAAGVVKCDLETLMKASDFVSVHVPLTKDTRHIIDEKALRLMKPTAYLINAGRGAIVDEIALYKVLKERSIAGAAIDVFEVEPIRPDDPLLELDNVFVTPHCAWHTRESMIALQTGAASEVALVLQGKMPRNAVNFKDVMHNLK